MARSVDLRVERGDMKYLQRRQNPLKDCSELEIEAALQKIADLFDENWLGREKGEHVLQKLWNRRDALATNELYTFGTALIASDHLDHDWLGHQLRLVSSRPETQFF